MNTFDKIINKMKRNKTYQDYLKSNNQEEFILLRFDELEYNKQLIDYVRRYFLEALRLANKNEFGQGLDNFTKERINLEMKDTAENILNILDGKGVCR